MNSLRDTQPAPLMELQKQVIYGPVQSRRLGSSLGINILPIDRKVCNFNCVYCQYGWTARSQENGTKEAGLPEPKEILAAIERGLAECSPAPSYLTFSGNGEATMHPDFPEIVDGLIEIRDRISPSTKTAILSNSTLLNNDRIRKAVERLDLKILKLDAGSHTVLKRFNRPKVPLSLEHIIEGIGSMSNVVVQSLWAAGTDGNFTPEHIPLWLDKVKQISPSHVQIYTLDRGYPSRSISKISTEELLSIRNLLLRENISAVVY